MIRHPPRWDLFTRAAARAGLVAGSRALRTGWSVLLVTAAVTLGTASAQTLPAPPPVQSIARPGDLDVPFVTPKLNPMTMTAAAGPRAFDSEHAGVFNGRRVKYHASLAETIITVDGRPAVSLFNTSYVVTSGRKLSRRPVIFAFNGGPGGASIFMHLECLGPKRMLLPPAGSGGEPTLVDNPASPLDVADLVFIDAPDTGYSRILPGAPPGRFYSIDGDSEALTQFVLHWLRTNQRLESPVYILGESYGSLRAVAMARDLARGEPRVVVSGVMLAGYAITFGSVGRVQNPALLAAELPSMASIAWHYGRIDNQGQTWSQAVDKARRFARDEYIGALMDGYRVDQATFDRIVAALPALIGIPGKYFRDHHTLTVDDFNAELLRDQGLVLDRNNGLVTHPTPPPGPQPEFDASVFVVRNRAMERYATRDLGVSGLGDYRAVMPNLMEVFRQWNFTPAGAPALDVTLSTLMREHPSMRLLVPQGRYDPLTDMGSTEYSLSQIDLPQDRVTIARFDGGHVIEPTPELMAAFRAFVSAGDAGGGAAH